MSNTVDLDLVSKTWERAWNQLNPSLLAPFLAENHVPHQSLNPVSGREGVMQFILAFQEAFPDLAFVVEDMIVAGEKIVLRWSMSGTQSGELMGIPPTRRRVRLTGISIYRFEDGRAVESWDELDMLNLLFQLGLLDKSEYN